MSLPKNRIREIRSLALKKVRDELGLFVAEGLRLVQDAAGSTFEIPEAFCTPEFESSPAGRDLIGILRSRGAACSIVSARDFARMADTVNAQGVLALVRKRVESAEDLIRRAPLPALLVALDGIADPGNLGSIIRTCDWFGATGVLLGRTSVDLYNPKAIRATMGGIFHVPVVTGLDLPDTAALAKRHGYSVYAADPRAGTFVADVAFTDRTLIALGNEAHGVSGSLALASDSRVAIRRYGKGESLNVGVACGVILSSHRLSLH